MKTISFDDFLSNLLARIDFRKQDFFISIQSTMTLDQFYKTQEQFYYAVINFSIPIALVAANIPTAQERMNIVKNLWEEHGEGDIERTHGETFLEFLRRMSHAEMKVKVPEITLAPLTFNSTLNEVCSSKNYLLGVSVIGIIERMFAEISNFISDSVIARGWLERNQMIHYSLHEELDFKHAEDFFSLLRPHWEDNDKRQFIQDGLLLGATTFMNLYQQLYSSVAINENEMHTH